MTLAPGVRFGAYEIISAIGAGGMGEVYRARDTRLNRDVAIKILPDLFANDADRVARFQREAQVLASLNHPNIAHIHGLEEIPSPGSGQAASKALVLEHVDGPTLADLIAQQSATPSGRLTRPGAPSESEAWQAAGVGPRGIPIDEALPIARQIAEALEAAHEHGIVHRDLKPANIKLTSEGTVKVLDFGLAKAATSPEAGTMASPLSMSPTITSPAMTMGGVILGTAAYMSPEQAKGKPVDKRADIWAFGCVLFEMLTGKRAFSGADVSDTLVAILRDHPDWSALDTAIPQSLHMLLRRCLEKDPKVRLRDIGEARVALGLTSGDQRPEVPSISSGQVMWRTAVLTLICGLLVGASGSWVFRPNSDERPVPVQRLSIRLPATTRLASAPVTVPIALSRDGTKLLYLGEGLGPRALYLRRLDQATAEMIRGTENAARPFFSPDGQHAAFLQRGRLMKVDLRGGTPVDMGVVAMGGGTWTDRDEIVYAGPPSAGGVSRLFAVSAAGGSPRQLPSRPDDPVYSQPHALPGGNAVLFTISPGVRRGAIAVMSLDSGDIRIVEESGEFPSFVSSGHIVFVRAGQLMVRPFDLDRLAATGPAVPAGENLQEGVYSVSHAGLLVYVAGGDSDPTGGLLAWVDRTGRSVPTPVERAPYAYPRLSRDVSRAVVGVGFGGGSGDISIVDLVRGGRVPLTHGDRVQGGNLSAIATWSHDERHVTFSSSVPDEYRLEQITADGTARREILLRVKGTLLQPGSWSHDGRTMVFYSGSSFGTGGERDLHVFDAQRKVMEPLLVTKSREVAPQLSPDSKWVAFVSDMLGRQEVYVMRFPQRTDVIPVSTSGGTEPVWARNGRELFYRNGRQMISVSFSGESKPVLGQPTTLFESEHRHDPSVSGAVPNYDVAADGRFLMVEGPPAAEGVDLSVVVNWTEELKRLAPAR